MQPWIAAVILLWGVALGASFWLQNIFVAHSGPIYDSMSYYNTLARVMAAVHYNGFWQGLTGSLHGTNTAMPWIMGSIISSIR
jgi:hypothetical protein